VFRELCPAIAPDVNTGGRRVRKRQTAKEACGDLVRVNARDIFSQLHMLRRNRTIVKH